MRPFSLFLPDPRLPEVACASLGRAIDAGRYRYEGHFETRADHRAEALRALPRIPDALWIDHADQGDVHRVSAGALAYEGGLLDLLGYQGLLDGAPGDAPLKLGFTYGTDVRDLPLLTAAIGESILSDSLRQRVGSRLEAGDTFTMSRPGLVRTMIYLVARINDRRQAAPETPVAVSQVLTGIRRLTASGQIAVAC